VNSCFVVSIFQDSSQCLVVLGGGSARVSNNRIMAISNGVVGVMVDDREEQEEIRERVLKAVPAARSVCPEVSAFSPLRLCVNFLISEAPRFEARTSKQATVAHRLHLWEKKTKDDSRMEVGRSEGRRCGDGWEPKRLVGSLSNSKAQR
jgi:hypothetical protein